MAPVMPPLFFFDNKLTKKKNTSFTARITNTKDSTENTPSILYDDNVLAGCQMRLSYHMRKTSAKETSILIAVFHPAAAVDNLWQQDYPDQWT